MTALILGATSDIAIAIARSLGSIDYNLQLAARDLSALQSLKNDLEIRNAISVSTIEFDAEDFKNHGGFYSALPVKPDVVFLVFGYLGNHTKGLTDWEESARIINTNYTGAVSVLNVVANDFEKRGAGTIVGISSVAGDRGRMSNYLYGSAKAGLTAYLSGLRNRLYHSGVHVLTVKPGFVRTQMTEGLPLPPAITANPEQVAKEIIKAIKKKRNTIYVLSVWSLIMMIIRSIPEVVFKKLKL